MSSSPTLRERLVDELKLAMKSGDKARVGAVRLIQAAVKDKDIESRGAGRGQASDDEILSVMQKMIKQRQESAAIYDKAGRADLFQQETEEIDIIAGFLPKQLDEAETIAAIDAAIASTGAQGLRDMGKAMAELRAAHAGRMDFAKASALLKERLK